mmetsp:Transcript_12595/g.15856  ORF Transcript_12595/g.15856 Transcript_12595/m.15856 type:complete len:1062 (+) Transcript_12595:124-3309(+)
MPAQVLKTVTTFSKSHHRHHRRGKISNNRRTVSTKMAAATTLALFWRSGGCRAFVNPAARHRGGPLLSRKLPSLHRHSQHRPAFLRSSVPAATVDSDSVTTTNTAGGSPTNSPYDVTNKLAGITGQYSPQFEEGMYKWWEDSGCFQPRTSEGTETKEPYVLPMPPPNVTGRLHMGHAIFVALQDVLARFHRMRGRSVLWLPGTDHAGIATQLQVEKALLSEGTSREEVGRETFLSRVWQYKEEQGGAITRQLRALGASADWTRERFTMDKDLSESVVEAFVRLHEKGLIYRGEYMVNWAPGLKTAVSDLEVEYTEEEGKLYYFKYVVDGAEDGDEAEHLPVATTRPETIVGDTAVCVHPEDPRYAHLIGKEVKVPMSTRTIPVIADEYVDREFGTGALKITPGHDPNDYTLGKKYDLTIINVMNKDGTMNENAGKYAGLDRFECREALWSDMEEDGLVIKVDPHTQRVPRSQRGGEIIEPLVSRQWFVKTEGMGAKALDAVKNKDITIIPSRFEKTWYQWLEDIHDWCISRQLWWGHRIPVWYVNDSEEYIVARNEEEARQTAIEQGHPDDVTLTQEEDVLDTWFSSGLWPFATLGWPENESATDSDLQKFYPSTCLETGYDILFFWVARMAMMGLELTGQSPFSVIYLHGLVRAADGSKMSKTKGNVVDPLDTVKEYGADSLRYSLVTGVTPGQDIPLNMEKVVANRNFANKLWNCCKFVTDNALKDMSEEEFNSLAVSGPVTAEEFAALPLPERHIISQCHKLVHEVTSAIEQYQLGIAGSKIYEFLWDEFADWYIEISKTRLYAGNTISGETSPETVRTARRTLVYILDTSLRLLHPYMPYVTEHLWHHLPRSAVSSNIDEDEKAHALMLADWPQMDDVMLVTNEDDERSFITFQALTRGIRNARAEYNVNLGKKIGATIVARSSDTIDQFRQELDSLVLLCKLDPESVNLVLEGSDEHDALLTAASSNNSVQVVIQDGVQAYLPLSDLIDPVKERQRLDKQKEKMGKEIEKLAKRLESPGFVEKAPEAVVTKARAELKELEEQMGKIEASLTTLAEV